MGDVIVTIDTRRVKHTHEMIARERWPRQGAGVGETARARGVSGLTTEPAAAAAAAAAHQGADNSNAIIATRRDWDADWKGKGVCASAFGARVSLFRV